MNEALLQFIWHYSLYKPGTLQTPEGVPITILYPGKLNRNAGPDFSEGKIKVGNTILAGNIELHVNSGDWLKHGHQHDEAYSRIILHVVYNNDVSDAAGIVPVLELKNHIPQYVLDQYTGLLRAAMHIPCAQQVQQVKEITKESWLSRLLAERWENKLTDWKELLDEARGDWRNLLYWRMAANFGFKINAVPFLMLARSLPLNILAGIAKT